MSNPFKIIEPTVIAFSGGRTSAYMLWRILQSNNGKLPEDAIVCFTNTGKEHESTLEFVKDCQEKWNVLIYWLEYNQKNKFIEVNYKTASRNGEPFAEMVRYKKMLPNNFMRFCTSDLKVNVIKSFLKSKNLDIPAESHLLGIRADEPRRIAKIGIDVCPLAQANITLQDIKNFWDNNNFDLNLPSVGYNQLSNCDLCFMKGTKILSSIISLEPKRAKWWIDMENEIKEQSKNPNKKVITFRKNDVSYEVMLNFNENQINMFDDQETIPCFCGD